MTRESKRWLFSKNRSTARMFHLVHPVNFQSRTTHSSPICVSDHSHQLGTLLFSIPICTCTYIRRRSGRKKDSSWRLRRTFLIMKGFFIFNFFFKIPRILVGSPPSDSFAPKSSRFGILMTMKVSTGRYPYRWADQAYLNPVWTQLVNQQRSMIRAFPEEIGSVFRIM